jgi:peroxiredoxin
MKKVLIIALFLMAFAGITNAQSYYDFTLQDLDGNDVTMEKVLEKGPVFLSFWATWCSPCKDEMKEMQKLYDRYKDQGFTYLAVNTDTQKSLSKVKSYISAKGYSFPVVLDTDKKIFEAYQGTGMPYSLLITPNKEIVAVHTGYVPGDEKKIEEEIKSAIGTK